MDVGRRGCAERERPMKEPGAVRGREREADEGAGSYPGPRERGRRRSLELSRIRERRAKRGKVGEGAGAGRECSEREEPSGLAGGSRETGVEEGLEGEDAVSGTRTPQDLDVVKQSMLEAYGEIVENCRILEQHYKDMMDIKFTVQENRLWMLQCRLGKCTGEAAVKIDVDMVKEGPVMPVLL